MYRSIDIVQCQHHPYTFTSKNVHCVNILFDVFLVDMNAKMIRPRFTLQINNLGWEEYITLCYLMNCLCPVDAMNEIPLNCSSNLIEMFSNDKVT